LITGTRGGKITLPTLAPGEALQLSFWHWYSLACSGWPCNSCSQGYVEISTNGGTSFTLLPGYSSFSGDSHGWYSPPPIDLSAYAGMQVRIAFHLVTNGCVESRGWFVDDVVIRKGWDPQWTSVEYPNFETWKNGMGGWLVDSPLWQVGVPANPPGPGSCSGVSSGGACAATRLAENYWAYADARLISPPIHLGTDAWLDFLHWYSLACSGWPCNSCDYAYVDVAVCQGQGWGPWQTKATFGGPSNGWTPAPSVDLTAYADSTVRISFHFTSDGCTESRGWLIDDIQISSVVTDVGGDGQGPLPRIPTLHQNVPNPFNPTTTISFSMPAEGSATLTIVDVTGRQVRRLVDEVVSAGDHHYTWNGRDDQGGSAASGVYMCKLRTSIGTSTRRMVLIR
jgi:hypothetical protein